MPVWPFCASGECGRRREPHEQSRKSMTPSACSADQSIPEVRGDSDIFEESPLMVETACELWELRMRPLRDGQAVFCVWKNSPAPAFFRGETGSVVPVRGRMDVWRRADEHGQLFQRHCGERQQGRRRCYAAQSASEIFVRGFPYGSRRRLPRLGDGASFRDQKLSRRMPAARSRLKIRMLREVSPRH